MYTMLHLSVRRMGFCMCWCMQSWCQLPILKKYAFLLFPQELVWPLEIFFFIQYLKTASFSVAICKSGMGVLICWAPYSAYSTCKGASHYWASSFYFIRTFRMKDNTQYKIQECRTDRDSFRDMKNCKLCC